MDIKLKILVLLLSCIGGLSMYAQEAYEDPIYAKSSSQKKSSDKNVREKDFTDNSINRLPNDSNIIYVEVPSNLKINDKIIMVNKTPYNLIQAAVVLINDGTPQLIGSATGVLPGRSAEMASYDHNWLKNIRGRTLGIKIKGVKDSNFQSESDFIGSKVEIINQDGKTNIRIDPMDSNDSRPQTTEPTYDFNISLMENRHDLYIIVNSGTKALDF